MCVIIYIYISIHAYCEHGRCDRVFVATLLTSCLLLFYVLATSKVLSAYTQDSYDL